MMKYEILGATGSETGYKSGILINAATHYLLGKVL